MHHDQCVFKCTPFPGEPPIYVGLYVNDFVYYSKSDKVEQWFETNLRSHVKVDFMGDVTWFFGQRYDYYNDSDGRLSCHISQQAMVEGILQKIHLQHLSPDKSSHPSGLIIVEIE